MNVIKIKKAVTKSSLLFGAVVLKGVFIILYFKSKLLC